MPKFDTNSNGYTLGFLAVMVIIVGGALAVLSAALAPIIAANIKLDERTKVLKSIIFKDDSESGDFFTAEYVNSEYEANVTAQLINYQGEVVEESIPTTYVFRKAMKEVALEERSLPLYTYTVDGENVYVIQMLGLGLWDEINGYLALEADKSTIKGVAFDHVGETPGLGAELVRSKFRKQFLDQSLFDADGNYQFVVYKAGKYKDGSVGVDGLSGATLTTDGIHAMMINTVETYKNFLEKE